MSETPGLDLILHGKPFPYTDADGTPLGCPPCPFATLEPGEDPFPDDEEAYYRCSLLDARVWGESPNCEREDWLKLARAEVAALSVRTMEGSSS